MGTLITFVAAATLAFAALAAQAHKVTPDDFTARHNANKAQAGLVDRILECPAGGNGWAQFKRGQAFVLCGGLGTTQSARIDCNSNTISPLNLTKLPADNKDRRDARLSLCAFGLTP
jgi:hypothetical protein